MNTVLVKNTNERYRTELRTAGHYLIADEPAPAGTNLGPNPYEYLLMALGSCTAMTVRMYADRKGWELHDVEVNLSQERVHAEDCQDCESKEGFVHAIEKEIRFVGNLSDDQRARLLEISARCPVHKTLEGEIRIREKLMN